MDTWNYAIEFIDNNKLISKVYVRNISDDKSPHILLRQMEIPCIGDSYKNATADGVAKFFVDYWKPYAVTAPLDNIRYVAKLNVNKSPWKIEITKNPKRKSQKHQG